MTIEASGLLRAGMKIQYLRMMVRGELLCQFYMLSVEIGSLTPENFTSILLSLGTYFFLLMHCQNKIARCATE